MEGVVFGVSCSVVLDKRRLLMGEGLEGGRKRETGRRKERRMHMKVGYGKGGKEKRHKRSR